MSEGEQVFVTYEGENTTGKRFRNTEIMTSEMAKSSRSKAISVGQSRMRPQQEVSLIHKADSD